MASPEQVVIFTNDERYQPIDNVLVRVFDTNDKLIDQKYSAIDPTYDDKAVAIFTLDGDDPPIDYSIHLSKRLVSFDSSLGEDSLSPQIISVQSPPDPNNFVFVRGQRLNIPVALDIYLCRISGIFTDISGQRLKNHVMTITPWCHNNNQPLINPILGSVTPGTLTSIYPNPYTRLFSIMGGAIRVRTDDLGYVEFDLYRSGHYQVVHQGMEDMPIPLMVPDEPSFNVAGLLLPHVGDVFLDSSTMLANASYVPVGSYIDMTIIAMPSDFSHSGTEYPERTLSNTRDNVEINPWHNPHLYNVEWIDDNTIRVHGLIVGSGAIGVRLSEDTIQVFNKYQHRYRRDLLLYPRLNAGRTYYHNIVIT